MKIDSDITVGEMLDAVLRPTESGKTCVSVATFDHAGVGYTRAALIVQGDGAQELVMLLVKRVEELAERAAQAAPGT